MVGEGEKGIFSSQRITVFAVLQNHKFRFAKSTMLYTRLVSLIICLIPFLEEFDDEDYLLIDRQQEYQPRPPMKNTIGKDIKLDLYGTAFFEPYVNLPKPLYDAIWADFECSEHPISEARNIYFEYDEQENKTRRRRKCKISDENRFIEWLHQMNEQPRVWTSAAVNGWNHSSFSRDFIHVTLQFVRTFSDEWVAPMEDDQKRDCMGIWSDFPQSYQAMDGSMSRRRKTKNLPPGVLRKDYYDYKLKMPEAIDVQAVCNPFGICTELLTGGPGSMGDSNLSHFVCNGDWNNSTLVDGTYANRPQFVKPDGSIEHKQARVCVEWLFGRNKLDWAMTGCIFRRASRWHNLVIRAAFTLSNMKRLYNLMKTGSM